MDASPLDTIVVASVADFTKYKRCQGEQEVEGRQLHCPGNCQNVAKGLNAFREGYDDFYVAIDRGTRSLFIPSFSVYLRRLHLVA